MKYKNLFSEAKIGNLTLKNRVVMEPMLLGVGEFDGTAGKRMMEYYEERAKGGVGLIITEITRISERNGATSPLQLAVTSDRHIEPLSEMAKRIHSHGAKLFVQLHHPGRQNLGMVVTAWQLSEMIGTRFGSWWDIFFSMTKHYDFLNQPIFRKFYARVPGATDIVCGLGASPVEGQRTRELKRWEIKELVKLFAQGAKRVQASGADGVEIHASHGYLIQQFLSPYTNKRKDEYGGNLKNRMRFLLDIISEVRRECGDNFPIVVRLTVDEFYRNIGCADIGIKLEEGVEIAKELEKAGIDALDISSGTYETMNYWLEPTSFEAGWRKYLAKAVKDAVDIPVIAANLIRTPQQAENQLKEGTQDFIGLGRPLLADPYWALKAQEEKEEEIQRCSCCLWCIESMYSNVMKGLPGECAVNPRTCHEVDYPLEPKKDGDGRAVAIVGAGPAGLMAAKVLGERGFKPVIFEKEKEIGGQLQLANKPPHKEKITWVIEDLATLAKKNGADIRLSTPATVEEIKKLKPYALIDATGGEAVKPKILGADGKNVCTLTEVLSHKKRFKNKKVAVIGSGMSGLETAEFLVEKGNEVIVVEMADTIAPGTWKQHTTDILPKLEQKGVKFYTSRKLVEIKKNAIVLESYENPRETIEIDNIVLAVGVKSIGIADSIKSVVSRIYKVGDAQKTGRISNATHTAYKVCMEL
ncbi:MAG: NAD(P)/FAD-dependent oxidoreductase [Oscillospiraceae bacterium]